MSNNWLDEIMERAELIADFVSDNRKDLEMEFTNEDKNEDGREAYILAHETEWHKFCKSAYLDYIEEVRHKFRG